MPLHDWSSDIGWENFHSFWIFRLADYLLPRLPEGYQLYLGSYSRAGLAMSAKPDLGVAYPPPPPPAATDPAAAIAPDDEVAVATVEPQQAIYIQYGGTMVAAVELVSPGNKDRPSERVAGTARYAAYVRAGIHLLLIDVHPSPAGFSFPDAIAAELGIPGQPSVPPPAVVAYRVGGRASAGGSYVAVWRRPLRVGEPLPILPLPLAAGLEIPVDLEGTYMHAARNARLP